MDGISRELSGVSERVQRWRERHGGPGKRIPQELWTAAAAVARSEGVEATARVLRLREERLAELVSELEGEGSASPAFIELGPLPASGKTVVELVSRRGDRMRVDVAGASSLDIARLARAFLRDDP